MPKSSTTRYGNGGHGQGWGGPAKGAGRPIPLKAWDSRSETRQTIPGGRGDEVKMKTRAERRAIRQERAEALEDHLYKLALSAEREETQVTAAARLHAIYEGQPVARNITATVDDIGQLSDDDLRDELARLGGTRTEAPEGAAPESLSRGSSDVVH